MQSLPRFTLSLVSRKTRLCGTCRHNFHCAWALPTALFYSVPNFLPLLLVGNRSIDTNFWSAWQDLNLRSPVPETGAWPLGYRLTIKLWSV